MYPLKIGIEIGGEIACDAINVRFGRGGHFVSGRGDVVETIAGLIPRIGADGAFDAAEIGILLEYVEVYYNTKVSNHFNKWKN